MTQAAIAQPKNYEFTVDWLSAHVQAWRALLESLRPTQLLEVGCYEGRTSSYLIEVCAAYGAAHLTCVDTWEGSVDLPPERMAGVEARFHHNVAVALEGAIAPVAVTPIKAPSAQVMARMMAEGRRFDFIYIDGSHTAPDVLTDAVLGFALLRVGGVMVFDDYLWCMEAADRRDPLNMPKPAIDAFTNIFMRRCAFTPFCDGMQFVVRKVAD